MTVVDAHHHFWAGHLPADLAPSLMDRGVDATVLVQAVDGPAENDRLREYAGATSFVAGVVGWLPLTDPEPFAARGELDRARDESWCGVRCLVGRDPIDRLDLALFRHLAAENLVWDIVPVTPAQRLGVLRIARAVPDLRVVVDHLGRPPLDKGGWQPWADQMRELAACPNVAVKVSVGIDVLTAWVWDPASLPRYVDWAMRCFGPERLMLASNWPVVLQRRDYVSAWDDLTAAVGQAGAGLDQVLGGCAGTWYGITPRPPAPARGGPPASVDPARPES
jgi:L-fuconolactonase